MAALTLQVPQITGTDIAYASAAGGGDTIAVRAGTYLLVLNGDSSETTVTVVRAGTQYGQANPDVAVAVGDGDTAIIGPIPVSFADTDGLVDITYSSVTSLSVAAIVAS